MAASKPDITLYFLNASRAIRVAWLLEELNVPYNLVSSDRAPNGLAPPEFRAKIPGQLRKSPTITDGVLVVQESAAILEYLCEQYDSSHRLIPSETAARAKVREFMAAAEGTFMVHCLALLYARWRLPKAASNYLPEFESGLSVNVHNDLDWLESELAASGGKYLVGGNLTAADIMVHFAIQFIYAKRLGVKETGEAVGDKGQGTGKRWERIEAWLHGLEADEALVRAVRKTGYVL